MSKLGVIGVGNAIVDVLAHCDEAFLATYDIPKGGMILIDETVRAAIYAAMTPVTTVCGGAAANTIACFASLGGHAGFIGKVADDELGEAFRADIKSLGVQFQSAPLAQEMPTGQCLVHVTPDAERSMTTFLGAAPNVTADDIIPEVIAQTDMVFFEGYLFEAPGAPEAYAKAARLVHAAGGKVAMTLSDAGCVDRQHDALSVFLATHVDVIFANEAEAMALTKIFDEGDGAFEILKDKAPLVIVTRAEKGCVIIGTAVSSRLDVPAAVPSKVLDTTGAGDSFAAGFLYGHSVGMSLEAAARLGNFVAAEIISHIGPRPVRRLEDLAKAAGVL